MSCCGVSDGVEASPARATTEARRVIAAAGVSAFMILGFKFLPPHLLC
jgi:hypothetical protein